MSTAFKTVSLFWRHVKKYPRYVVGLAIAMPLTILADFIPAIIAASVLEKLSKGQFDPNNLWASFGPDFVLYAILIMLGGIIGWRVIVTLIWRLESHVMRDITRKVFDHLMNMSANFHANRFGGSLVSQTGKLAGAYMRFQDTTVFDIVPLALSFVFTAVILLPRAPIYVAALFAFSAIFMATAIFATGRVRQLVGREASAQNKQTGYLADAITNVLAVKSFAAGRSEQKRFYDSTETTRLATMDVMRAAVKRDVVFSSITSSITMVSFGLAIVSVMFWKSDIATVFLVLNYTGSIVRHLWEFAHNSLRQYNRALGDSKEMIEILDIAPEVKDPIKPERPRIKNGEIQFNDIQFRHADADGDLFNHLQLKIKPGEKVGLVGHSGSGKTTLTKLLLRFADIDGGEILIDGQNIANIKQDDLRRHIAYVPQEPLLFHRSISENIAYSTPTASAKQIANAARHANAAEFVETLPKGYDTMVGERGVKLSGGQRQRIAIARAMLKDAPILVLDEATSALDSESEQLIQQALWQLMKGRTAIVIAHRLSTIQKMDRIVVMENGRIIEQGSHTELLAKKGTYAKLWSHQSGGFLED